MVSLILNPFLLFILNGERMSTNVENESIQIQSKEDMKNLIKEWLKLDDLLKQSSKELKTIRKRKKDLTDSLAEYMSSQEFEVCKTSKGMVKCKKSVRTAPLSKQNLENVLLSYLGTILDENEDTLCEKAHEAVDFIYEHRGKVESNTIQRVKE